LGVAWGAAWVEQSARAKGGVLDWECLELELE